jgi:hypothetical protein
MHGKKCRGSLQAASDPPTAARKHRNGTQSYKCKELSLESDFSTVPPENSLVHLIPLFQPSDTLNGEPSHTV